MQKGSQGWKKGEGGKIPETSDCCGGRGLGGLCSNRRKSGREEQIKKEKKEGRHEREERIKMKKEDSGFDFIQGICLGTFHTKHERVAQS